MSASKLLKVFKILVIVFLVMAISMVSILQWKSDMIIDRVLTTFQKRLVDSLQYSDAQMDWFGHFPSVAVQISDLRIGSGDHALIQNGYADVVISMFPLLKNKVIINRFQLSDATLQIVQQDGRWNYAIFKKTDTPASDTAASSSFNTLIRELVLENTEIRYRDGNTLSFSLSVLSAKLDGHLKDNILESKVSLEGNLDELKMEGFTLSAILPLELEGKYAYDLNSEVQTFSDWTVSNESISMTGGGTYVNSGEKNEIDLNAAWKKGNLDDVKKWLPAKTMKDFDLSGDTEGRISIAGDMSKNKSPHIQCQASLKNGTIHFRPAAETIKGLKADLKYDNGGKAGASASLAEFSFSKSAMLSGSLEGIVQVRNLDKPTIKASLRGTLPANLLNLLIVDSLHFKKGEFLIHHFNLDGYRPATSNLSHLLSNTSMSLSGKDLALTYLGNPLILIHGDLSLEKDQIDLSFDEITWKKATITNLKSKINVKEDLLDYTFQGKICDGTVETTGQFNLSTHARGHTAIWKAKSINIQTLMASFENFDQTFITSENLSGTADIWAETTIPFDTQWRIRTKEVQAKCALDIRDGRLKNLKTLEDFAKYVHIEDLRDIRFNQLKNYLWIENGRVQLPVMFIQSSAMNMSISGSHGFDHSILYFIKLNAGQTVSNKLRKLDVFKELKQARKSGWINMYFVLNGTVSDVRYQQNRTLVVSGFEQSSLQKENLRNYLVEKFGYDVYWLEPNEWEDIPEY